MSIAIKNFKQPNNIPVAKRRYRLATDYTCYWSENGQLYKLVIPAGFEYDGASIPRLLWSFSDLTPDGIIRAAALVHDYIYDKKGSMGQTLYENRGGDWIHSLRKLTRKNADNMFSALMKRAGIGKTSRRQAYWAVRLFGWYAWRT